MGCGPPPPVEPAIVVASAAVAGRIVLLNLERSLGVEFAVVRESICRMWTERRRRPALALGMNLAGHARLGFPQPL